MRCDDFRAMIEEALSGALPEELHAHLDACAECRAYAEDWAKVSAGFRAVGAEPPPDPSFGFAERCVRRLAEPSGIERAASEFIERVGKRVAFATVLLAMLALLVLGLPAASPVREPSGAELMAQDYQASNTSGIIFADDAWISQSARPEAQGAVSHK